LYWVWWALAAILVGAELMTGTFYLLAVGVAFAVAVSPLGLERRCRCSSSLAAY